MSHDFNYILTDFHANFAPCLLLMMTNYLAHYVRTSLYGISHLNV